MSLVSAGNAKIACVLVGLPARGKTYIGQKLSRYLRWLGINTKILNVGDYRRKHFGAGQSHEFFASSNAQATALRLEAAVLALNDMIKWFTVDGGQVAIYDATNNTKERREMLRKRLKEDNIEVLFIESVCTDQDVIMSNIREVKLSSPDYVGRNPDEVVEDFKQRIHHYEVDYETVGDDEGSYIKLVNVGKEYQINHVQGFLQSKICYFLMNLHITPRSIYMTRHGESEFNVQQRIGGDSNLSVNGQQYAKALTKFFAEKFPSGTGLTVWTSTFKRTIQTGEGLPFPKLQWKALDELDAGVCDGLTYEEIEAQFPDDFAARDDDKFNYRYRAGESYRDMVLRLEPIIMELERQTDILIIGHQAVLRVIFAYFKDCPHDELPYMHVPLHTVIKFTPKAYKNIEEVFPLNIQAVDTHRDPRKQKH